MRLTRGTDYALRGMVSLAQDAPGHIALVSALALREGVPESYLAKIFQDLARSGIVHSHRGARGGFSLARPADTITLRQIIEAVEGPIALNTCLEGCNAESCNRQDTCPVYPVLRAAQDQLIATLDGTTLAELARREP